MHRFGLNLKNSSNRPAAQISTYYGFYFRLLFPKSRPVACEKEFIKPLNPPAFLSNAFLHCAEETLWIRLKNIPDCCITAVFPRPALKLRANYAII
jgi:hypothetical protein